LNGLDHIILLLVSLVANTFSAFSGGGAGLIQFPVLLFLGLSFGVALATHKVASVALGGWRGLTLFVTECVRTSVCIVDVVVWNPRRDFGCQPDLISTRSIG